MPWGYVIVAAASAYSANKASSAADRAGAQRERASRNELEFAKEQYADWQAIYGPIQENLAEFYSTLDESTITSLQLARTQEGFNQYYTQMQDYFAKAGVTGGAQAQLLQSAKLEEARTKAGIRAAAPLQLAEAQGNFLAAGRGAVNPYASAVAGGYSTMSALAADREALAREQEAMGYQIMASSLAEAGKAYGRQQAKDELKDE